jgi:poly(A) polymerase
MSAPQQWGTTPPVSTAFPTEKEIGLNDTMIEELKGQNNFEAPDETEKRTVVLRTLQKITVEFVRLVGKEKKMPEQIINDAGGKIFTFGSYRLGVFGPGMEEQLYVRGYLD